MGLSPRQKALLSFVRTGAKKKKKIILEDLLFPKQLEFVKDPSKKKIAVCSRRAGKTLSCAWDLLETANSENLKYFAAKEKGEEYFLADCLYVTLERSSARGIFWKVVTNLIEEYGIECHLDNNRMVITWPAGNKLYVTGVKDAAQGEKWRGYFFKKIYVDEVQSFREYVKDFVNEVLDSTIIDVNGSIILIGTPSLVLSGFFYDTWINSNFKKFKWTLHDNPWIKIKSGLDPHELILQKITERNVAITHPSVRREFFGEFVEDPDSLVFKFKGDFFDILPSGQWYYVLGIDLGFQDSDALAVLAYSYESPKIYCIEEITTEKQAITPLINQILELKKKYEFSKMVIDSGGLGLKIAEEIKQRHGLNVEAAQKNRKVEFINLMNDDFNLGNVLFKTNSIAVEDMKKMEWDPDKKKHGKWEVSKKFHSDICDAVLYAWRECRAYAHTLPEVKPEEGTPEWYKMEAERMEQETLENIRRQREDQF